MKIRESRLQKGKIIYKTGISFTKVEFHLQRGSLALQTGLSDCYSPFKVTLFRKVINDAIKVSNAVKNMSNGLLELSNALKNVGSDAQKKDNEFVIYLKACEKAGITPKFISNIEKIFGKSGTELVFGQADVQVWLGCSKSKATNVMNAMKKAEILTKVKGFGPGKYKFINGGK